MGGKKLEKFEKELEYFAGYTIAKSLYSDGVISFKVFDRINIGMAQNLGVVPYTEISHIRQNECKPI